MNDQQRFEYEVQREQWLEEQEAQQTNQTMSDWELHNNVMCKCGNPVHPRRVEAGYYWCMDCGEKKATEARMGWCISIPYSKGAYQLITDTNDMKQTNPKRTHY